MKIYRYDCDIRNNCDYSYNNQRKIILISLSRSKKKICVLQFFKSKEENCLFDENLQSMINEIILGNDKFFTKISRYTDPKNFIVIVDGNKFNYAGSRILDIDNYKEYSCSVFGTELSLTWNGSKNFDNLSELNFVSKNNFISNFVDKKFGMLVLIPIKNFSLEGSIIFVNESCYDHRCIKFLNFDEKDLNDFILFRDVNDVEKLIKENLPTITINKNGEDIFIECVYKEKFVDDILYIKTDKGYITHNKIELKNGKGNFKFIPLGLGIGEEVTIKVGFKMFSNLACLNFKV